MFVVTIAAGALDCAPIRDASQFLQSRCHGLDGAGAHAAGGIYAGPLAPRLLHLRISRQPRSRGWARLLHDACAIRCHATLGSTNMRLNGKLRGFESTFMNSRTLPGNASPSRPRYIVSFL